MSKADLKKAFDALPVSEQDLLKRTADRIRNFALAQVDTTIEFGLF